MSVSTLQNERSQNIRFSDQREHYTYHVESEIDETRKGQDSNDAELGNFFSRPIKIREIEWGTGTTMFDSFNPWTLYFENPRVANRIANYHLLRCKLCIKVVINGNGFQYGRAIASYLPLSSFDQLSQNIALIPETIVQASQQPHLYLDPTLSRGGEMCLPFFYHKNNLSIPDSNWQDMGALTIRSINPLKHANGASDQVTISVFAWAEDVNINVLTSRESSTLSPQSGKEEIEEANNKGFISGPATALSNLAGKLGVVPWLGPYARATAELAAGVAGAAKALGYARPPMTANPMPYRPTVVSSLSLTTVPDTVQKLTLDDKQELTIDPRIAGLGSQDSLVITDIAKRESYLTTFDWNIGTAPETLLWNARVSPVTWAENGSGSTKSYHFPACAMAAMPFEYWTGTMKFRFQFVASAFHKGRVKIVYDPNWLASNEYNTNYLEIVDISEKSDFTISVSNGQEYTLLTRHFPGEESVTQLYSSTTYTSKEQGNGVIGVYVVNELTTPNSAVDNSIEVNVFVSMDDDFEVFVPDARFQEFVFQPQSGLEVAESENTQEKDAPVQQISTSLGDRYDNHKNMNLVFTGESIKSFRSVLKRYNHFTPIVFGDTISTLISLTQYMFPYLRGNVDGAVQVTSAAAPYNYCNTVMLHWVTYAFSGWRGSIRYKAMPDGYRSETTRITSTVTRLADVPYGYDYVNYSTPTYTSNAKLGRASIYSSPGTTFGRQQKPTGVEGGAWAVSNINEALEFEIPFYSRYRFSPGKTENWTTDDVGGRINTEGFRYTANSLPNLTTAIHFYVAAGEDFQVYFFTGLPPMYWENSPPTA
jgi:hypothetical protein